MAFGWKIFPVSILKEELIKIQPMVFILTFVFTFFIMGNAWPQSINSKMREGVSRYQQKDYEKAVTLFTETLKEQPNNPNLLYNLGNSLYKNGHFEESLKTYSQSGSGNTPEKLKQKSIYNSGNALYRLGKLEEAEKAYKKALEMDPKDMDAKFNLEFVREKLKDQKQSKQQRDEKQDSNSGGEKDQNQNSSSTKGNQNSDDNNPENFESSGEQSSPSPQTAQNLDSSNSESEKTKSSTPELKQFQEGNISKHQADQWLGALDENLKSIRQKQARRAQAGSSNPDKDW